MFILSLQKVKFNFNLLLFFVPEGSSRVKMSPCCSVPGLWAVTSFSCLNITLLVNCIGALVWAAVRQVSVTFKDLGWLFYPELAGSIMCSYSTRVEPVTHLILIRNTKFIICVKTTHAEQDLHTPWFGNKVWHGAVCTLDVIYKHYTIIYTLYHSTLHLFNRLHLVDEMEQYPWR